MRPVTHAVVDDELDVGDPTEQDLLVLTDKVVATPGQQQRRDADVLQRRWSFHLEQAQERLPPNRGGYPEAFINEARHEVLSYLVRGRGAHELLHEARVDWIGQRHDVLAHGGDPGFVGRRAGAANEDQAGYTFRMARGPRL